MKKTLSIFLLLFMILILQINSIHLNNQIESKNEKIVSIKNKIDYKKQSITLLEQEITRLSGASNVLKTAKQQHLSFNDDNIRFIK